MLQRVREWLSLGLLILLPFHAFAVTVFTKLIAGPGHAPLSQIAIWKETVLGIILLIAFIEILGNRKKWEIDLLDGLIALLLIVAFLISDLRSQISTFTLGFKYDFIPLIAFVVLRRVLWSDRFRSLATTAILSVASIISVYGILTLLLPDSFFMWLGYSSLHSLYIPTGPIAAFQQIGGAALHRIQSTFSGPNQLGIWLLIPIAISASVMLSSSKHAHASLFDRLPPSPLGYGRTGRVTQLLLFLIALALTFSRAAWIGAFVIIIIALYPFIQSHLTRARLLGAVFALIILVFIAVDLFPNTILRLSSTRGHIDRPLEAIGRMIDHPFGTGLGTAGPATNRSSDTCVMLRPEDDPSWAKDHADLCVFLGDLQVQPTGRACNCPFLPENWYLQIGVEIGFLGFILYVLLIGMLVWRLRLLSVNSYLLSGVFYAFVGISIAALFLHAWEDTAVAYTGWMMVAVALSIF